jgi:hypothetical protein
VKQDIAAAPAADFIARLGIVAGLVRFCSHCVHDGKFALWGSLADFRVAILFSECIGDLNAQVSGFRDQGTEVWARENTN